MDVRQLAIIENDIIHHCSAQLLTATARVEDQHRHEVQCTVEDLLRALRPGLPQRIPCRAVVKRRRLENGHCLIQTELGSLVASPSLFTLCAELAQVDFCK